jgi:triosephosphate isomerase
LRIFLVVETLRGLNMKSLVFASDIEELKKVLVLKPDFVSYEPPELIGSRDKSAVTERPEVISEAVELSKKESVPLIVGAGIHSRKI